jgi:CubicO group peptidase (beta-lactamase class C family)
MAVAQILQARFTEGERNTAPSRHTGAMTLTPRQLFDRGVAELGEVLGPAGFTFAAVEEDDGGGGLYAIGEFRRGERRLELHFRRSLGLVRYHFGEESLSHEELVRGVRGTDRIAAEGQFPGFSDDGAGGFRYLRADLERFGAIFLTGGAKAFRALKKWLDKHPRKSGLAGLER